MKSKKQSPRSLLDKAYKLLQKTKLDSKFENAPTVAMLSGPAIVIEAIVAKAQADTGIEMDWGYSSGRAFVHALGDAKKARSALYCAIPQSDLTQMDL